MPTLSGAREESYHQDIATRHGGAAWRASALQDCSSVFHRQRVTTKFCLKLCETFAPALRATDEQP